MSAGQATHSESQGTPFRLGYQPALDGIRAFAVLAVMVGHASQVAGWRIGSGGGIGVFVFFVLSGFLITALLIEERDRTGTNRLGKFYARRALRLLPALVVVLAFCALYRLVSSSQNAIHTADAIPRRCSTLRTSTASVRTPWARWATPGRSRWRSSSTCSGRSW